jgi:hypothetical protein
MFIHCCRLVCWHRSYSVGLHLLLHQQPLEAPSTGLQEGRPVTDPPLSLTAFCTAYVVHVWWLFDGSDTVSTVGGSHIWLCGGLLWPGQNGYGGKSTSSCNTQPSLIICCMNLLSST